MEARHAANATAKALRAVQVIETDLLWLWKDDPDFPEVTDTNSVLRFAHWTLFGAGRQLNPQLAEATWDIIGLFYAINWPATDRTGKVVEFDTSRPFIKAELINRAGETNAPQDDDSDPFVGLRYTTIDDVDTVRR